MVRFIAYIILFAIFVKCNMLFWGMYNGKEPAYGMLGIILFNFIGFPILFGLVERITGPNVEEPYVEPEVFGSRLVVRVPDSDSNELL